MSKRKKHKVKTKVIYVRVSPEDHAQIEKLAAKSGYTVAELARFALTRLPSLARTIEIAMKRTAA
jgi:hypothetical protein